MYCGAIAHLWLGGRRSPSALASAPDGCKICVQAVWCHLEMELSQFVGLWMLAKVWEALGFARVNIVTAQAPPGLTSAD